MGCPTLHRNQGDGMHYGPLLPGLLYTLRSTYTSMMRCPKFHRNQGYVIPYLPLYPGCWDSLLHTVTLVMECLPPTVTNMMGCPTVTRVMGCTTYYWCQGN